MPCRRAYWPLKMLARLVAQIDVVTNAFVNRTPSAAIASMCGVRTIELPAQPSVSHRWSSVNRKITLGRLAGVSARPTVRPHASAPRPIAVDCRNARRVVGCIIRTPFFATPRPPS